VPAYHFLVGGFEGTVVADMVPLGTELAYMLIYFVLGNRCLAVEGTLNTHILAVGIQVDY